MKIGILGGGQLARMIIEDCNKYGFEFHILSKEKNSPAGQITPFETAGDWNDDDCLKKFASGCDIITLENEFIDSEKIKLIEDSGKKVYPASCIIKLIQDKLYQKKTLAESGIPVAKFCEVNSKKEILNFAEEKNFPVILKSRTMGYDGKGNFKIDSPKEIDEAFDMLSKRGKLMCESFVKFDREIATQVARSITGEVKVYPAVETIQKDHICHMVIAAGGRLDPVIEKKVNDIAVKIVSDLDYAGVMGIEMFLTGNTILVNELAPRVHNSGHYTIEGCYTSQFENHIRAIAGLPLGNVEMRDDAAVMINILGEHEGKSELKNAEAVLKERNAYLHVYGKTRTGIGRKMGHITVTGEEVQETIGTAERCREKISI